MADQKVGLGGFGGGPRRGGLGAGFVGIGCQRLAEARVRCFDWSRWRHVGYYSNSATAARDDCIDALDCWSLVRSMDEKNAGLSVPTVCKL